MKRYLVIETSRKRDGCEEQFFTHFIDLRKERVLNDVSFFVHHLNSFLNQEVRKVYFSDSRLTNW